MPVVQIKACVIDKRAPLLEPATDQADVWLHCSKKERIVLEVNCALTSAEHQVARPHTLKCLRALISVPRKDVDNVVI